MPWDLPSGSSSLDRSCLPASAFEIFRFTSSLFHPLLVSSLPPSPASETALQGALPVWPPVTSVTSPLARATTQAPTPFPSVWGLGLFLLPWASSATPPALVSLPGSPKSLKFLLNLQLPNITQIVSFPVSGRKWRPRDLLDLDTYLDAHPSFPVLPVLPGEASSVRRCPHTSVLSHLLGDFAPSSLPQGGQPFPSSSPCGTETCNDFARSQSSPS